MKKTIDWPRFIVHAGAWVTLAALALNYFFNPSLINPILTFEHQTGKTALIFLILSLACSPAAAILDIKAVGKRKKALGVYGFMFAAVHLLVYLGIDYRFQFKYILPVSLHTPYIWVGGASFLMLLALAITSFKKTKQLLKKNWKRLHRLVYVISPLIILHFLLIVKGNFLSLQGALTEPLIYGSIVLLLLLLRIPPVKRGLINFRMRVQNRKQDLNPV
jgi:methionine sulfoxide reductase heme-binding subunit